MIKAKENGEKKSAAAGKNRIRILIAEDHTVVRDGLVAIVKQEKDMEVVAETGDGRQAVELWKKHRPDVTLMDLRMPGLDGVNAIYEIRAADPNMRTRLLSKNNVFLSTNLNQPQRMFDRGRPANRSRRV